MSKIGILLASAMMVSEANKPLEQRHFEKPFLVPRFAEPDWKRKKCKSCKLFSKVTGGCDAGYWASPDHQACKEYQKRK